MKKMIACMALFVASCGLKADAAAYYSICKWQDDCTAAVSYTYDDDLQNQFDIIVPILDKYGFKGTFFTVTDWATNRKQWDILRELAANGHEIGSHTVSHPTLTTSDEMVKSKEKIEKEIGMPCLTIAYPYCNYPDNQSVLEKNYISGRTCSGQIIPNNQEDYFNFSSFICGTEGSVKTLRDFKTQFGNAKDEKGWCVLLIHEVDEGDGYSPTSSEELDKSMEYLSNNGKTFWVATFRDVSLYIREAQYAKRSEISADDDSIVMKVTDRLDNNIYNYPLTVRRELPEGWADVSVTQNGNEMKSWVSGGYMYYYAVPDGGNVIIRKTGTTRIGLIEADADAGISLSFSGSRISVNSVSPVTGIVLTDLSGRRVYTAAEGSELDASKVRRGTYVLDVSTADGCQKAFKLAFGR